MAWWAKLITIFDRFGRNAEKADHKAHGALQAGKATGDAYDKSRKSAAKLGRRKHTDIKSSGVRRTNGDDSRKG